MTDPQWPDDFGPVPLPSWVKPDDRWKGQLEVAKQIVSEFETNDAVFLQAPTGAGKTLIGELVRRLMNAKGVYTCSTKALQHQFEHDFNYAKVLKGRSNYTPQLAGDYLDGEVTCADCNWNTDSGDCSWCASRAMCPYIIARSQAEHASLAVLNTSYLLTDLTKGQARFGQRDLYIIDEADILENEFLSHIEVKITRRQMAKMGLVPPGRKTIEASWYVWVDDVAEPGIRSYLARLPSPYRRDADPKLIREYARVEDLLHRVRLLQQDIRNGGWVYDGYQEGNVIFRPVRANRYGNDLLWKHGSKFLLMSATILSADLMADELGLCYVKDRPFTTIDLPSTYPVKNRPIHYAPLANMKFAEKHTEWPKALEAVKGVLREHPDERVLVHTVSYELAKYIESGLKAKGVKDDPRLDRPIVTYLTSIDKDFALRKYKRYERSVMVAASMDRGIDLPNDECRVQVILKVPYPNTSDKRVNARLHGLKGGQAWYRMQAVRSLIQMTGRGVRSADDYAVTYIVDSQFGTNLYATVEYLFPEWWKEAINWRFNPRKLITNRKRTDNG